MGYVIRNRRDTRTFYAADSWGTSATWVRDVVNASLHKTKADAIKWLRQRGYSSVASEGDLKHYDLEIVKVS